MTTAIQPAQSTIPSHTVLRSIGGVAAAFVVMAIVTGIVDQILHWFGVFPPWGQVTYETGPYVLAVIYRTVFGVAGAFLAARWAPRAPMRHALSLGGVGIVFGLAGVVAAVIRDFGPVWYPVTLVVLTLPAAWAGGAISVRRSRAS